MLDRQRRGDLSYDLFTSDDGDQALLPMAISSEVNTNSVVDENLLFTNDLEPFTADLSVSVDIAHGSPCGLPCRLGKRDGVDDRLLISPTSNFDTFDEFQGKLDPDSDGKNLTKNRHVRISVVSSSSLLFNDTETQLFRRKDSLLATAAFYRH